jgi:hypothetical protein
MPWCDSCSRFYNPNTLRPDGSCPTCERVVVDDGAAGAVREQTTTKAPWHFKLLVAATVIYIAWRIVQMVGWAIN